MKDTADTLENASRRRFTKSVAIAVAAAPLAATLTGCRPTDNNNNTTNGSSNKADLVFREPTVFNCDPAGGGVTHEPPVIIGGGNSCFIEIHDELQLMPPGTAPYIYRKSDPDPAHPDPYLEIVVVRVITELKTPLPGNVHLTDKTYIPFPTESQLLIWFEKLNNAPSGPKDPDCTYLGNLTPDPNPQIAIRGGNQSGSAFEVKVNDDDQFDHELTHKCNRPHRHIHKGRKNWGRHFRIGRWRITDLRGNPISFKDENGQSVKGEAEGDDAYHIYISFADQAFLRLHQK